VLGLHVGAEDGVDAGLVAVLLADQRRRSGVWTWATWCTFAGMQPATIEHIKSLVTVAGAVGSFVVFSIGLSTYLRTEKWKRAEFLANEMKEFFSTPRVQKTFLLIDWGCREVQLLEDRSADEGRVIVTRQMQTMGLRPHVLLNRTGSDPEVFTVDDGVSGVGFTRAEAAIRDCYDAFLDGLERFSSYVETGLIDVASLRPYIGYWIADISSPTENADDAAWCAALLTYISFYRFDGVLRLFDAFGSGIRPSSATYISFLKHMADQKFASLLAGTVKCEYPARD